jgi:hypothetical protein
VTPIMALFLTIDISVFLNDLTHSLEEVIVTQSHDIFPCSLDHLLGVNSRGAVDRAVHTGGTAQQGLSYSLRNRKLSLHHFPEKNHLTAGIGNGSLGQFKDGADRPTKPAPGALRDRLSLLFIQLQLIRHCISSKIISPPRRGERKENICWFVPGKDQNKSTLSVPSGQNLFVQSTSPDWTKEIFLCALCVFAVKILNHQVLSCLDS